MICVRIYMFRCVGVRIQTVVVVVESLKKSLKWKIAKNVGKRVLKREVNKEQKLVVKYRW